MEPPAINDFCAATTAAARQALAERQLEAIERREPQVRAFVSLDTAAARRGLGQTTPGPLGGALLAAKDVIATADFPTCYGARDRAASGPRIDAWCIAMARRRGGVLLGKTVCTEFAYPLPGPTTNPHDASRTPGGSSSGSAAAVAAGFASFAFGTQTAGSTIRPASYCGVTGMKPSYGLLPIEGIQAISTTCDHLGLFAVSPRDVWYLVSAMSQERAEVLAPRRPQRVLFLRLPAELPLGDRYPKRLAGLRRALQDAGVIAETIDLPFPLADFTELQKDICYWEAARLLLAPGRRRLVPELEALLGPYLRLDGRRYGATRRRRQLYQARFAALIDGFDAMLLPAATGAAPPVSETGDAVMSRFWTALHIPAITVPLWKTAEGLPLGLQLLAGLGRDRALAEVAQWFFERLRA